MPRPTTTGLFFTVFIEQPTQKESIANILVGTSPERVAIGMHYRSDPVGKHENFFLQTFRAVGKGSNGGSAMQEEQQ